MDNCKLIRLYRIYRWTVVNKHNPLVADLNHQVSILKALRRRSLSQSNSSTIDPDLPPNISDTDDDQLLNNLVCCFSFLFVFFAYLYMGTVGTGVLSSWVE